MGHVTWVDPAAHDLLCMCDRSEQVALEDSMVTMATILSSRFVGGIRPEVEKVERLLTLFAETLDEWVQVGLFREV